MSNDFFEMKIEDAEHDGGKTVKNIGKKKKRHQKSQKDDKHEDDTNKGKVWCYY